MYEVQFTKKNLLLNEKFGQEFVFEVNGELVGYAVIK
jgi:hypothetical protein